MRTISKEFSFAYGHRLRFHNGVCKNIHGHNALLIVTLGEPKAIPPADMILDFSIVKKCVKEWLDLNWEHAMIVAKEDTELGELLMSLPNQKIFILNGEPTAENMASHLFHTVLPVLFKAFPVTIERIKFYETQTSCTEISA